MNSWKERGAGALGALLKRLHLQQQTADALENLGEAIEPEPPPPTLVEWGARGLSLLLLLLLVGYLIFEALSPTQPIAFDYQVQQDAIRQQGAEWVVPVSLQNQGSRGLLDLVLRAQLTDEAGNPVEEIEVALLLLGAGERVDMELWFSEDPRTHPLTLDVQSYRLP